MEWLYLALIVIGAYFLGAVPFGLVYSLARGFDIRTFGSGNIGATNVGRKFGFVGGFVPVFLLDVIKGAIPVLVVRIIGLKVLPDPVMGADLAMLAAGFAAILGHTFPVYLKFKGGKGVATTAGVFAVLSPVLFAIGIGVFLVMFLITRIVSVSSMLAGVSLAVGAYLVEPSRPLLLWLTIPLALLVIFLHRSNIQKLLKGEEKRFEFGKKKKEAGQDK